MKIIKKIITFLGIIFLGTILLMLIDSNIGGGNHIYAFLWLLMVAAALVFVIRWKPRKTSKAEDYKEPIYFRDVIAKLLKNSYLRFTFIFIILIIFNQIFPLTSDQLDYVVPNYLIFSVLLSFPKTRTKKVFFSIAGIYLFLLSMVLLSELMTSNDISSDDLESWWVKGPFIFIGLCVWYLYIGYKSNKSKKLGEENFFTDHALDLDDLVKTPHLQPGTDALTDAILKANPGDSDAVSAPDLELVLLAIICSWGDGKIESEEMEVIISAYEKRFSELKLIEITDPKDKELSQHEYIIGLFNFLETEEKRIEELEEIELPPELQTFYLKKNKGLGQSVKQKVFVVILEGLISILNQDYSKFKTKEKRKYIKLRITNLRQELLSLSKVDGDVSTSEKEFLKLVDTRLRKNLD